MDLFGSVILAIMATGSVLVIGGLFLIGSGALKLVGDKSSRTTLKVGAFLQLATTVPGLGIFLLGLAFHSVGLYYANEARRDDMAGQIASAVQKAGEEHRKEREEHALRLAGIVQMDADQEVRLSVCMGQQLILRANNPFESSIGPYLDFVVVKLETEGAIPQLFTISGSDHVAPSFRTFSHLIQPQHGLVDIGSVRLEQVVNLGPAVRDKLLQISSPPPRIPAGSAYGSNP